MIYPHIETAWERDPATKFETLIEGRWARPEFGYLHHLIWLWTEMINGMNIRVELASGLLGFAGRTAISQLPAPLRARLTERFPDPATLAYALDIPGDARACLYGEGYGKGIQAAGPSYLADTVDFILFDISVGDRFLPREEVLRIANTLALPTVPAVGQGTLEDAIQFVREGFHSRIGNCPAEGLVVRPSVELYAADGSRVITKIKTRDFRPG